MFENKNISEIESLPIDPKLFEMFDKITEVNKKIIEQNSEIIKQNTIVLQGLAAPRYWLKNPIIK